MLMTIASHKNHLYDQCVGFQVQCHEGNYVRLTEQNKKKEKILPWHLGKTLLQEPGEQFQWALSKGRLQSSKRKVLSFTVVVAPKALCKNRMSFGWRFLHSRITFSSSWSQKTQKNTLLY